MSGQDFAWARDALMDRKAEILALQASSVESRGTVELDQTSVGRVSRVDALQNQAMAQATQRNREAELGRIEAALRRMEQGTFGQCVICGEEIAAKRLRLDPALATCIECAH